MRHRVLRVCDGDRQQKKEKQKQNDELLVETTG